MHENNIINKILFFCYGRSEEIEGKSSVLVGDFRKKLRQN